MIYINNIPSFRNPEEEEFIPDDRQERIEIIGDIEVQDLGRVENGDVISLQCMFSAANFELLKALWLARTKVTYTDTGGQQYQNMRIKITRWKRDRDFPNYFFVNFELWRV